MNLSYKARKGFKKAAGILLIVLLTAAVAGACWVIWLGRFVTYSREGAELNMELPPIPVGETAEPVGETVGIYYNEGDDAIATSTELTQMKGYYISAEELSKKADFNDLKRQLQALPAGTAVMIDLKNIYGNFLYSSDVSSYRSDSVDTEKVDNLIRYLDKSGLYTIARVPAFRDREYGLNHVNDGLGDAAYNGGCLWSDDEGCYWLNPNRQGIIQYLVNIVLELRGLGFDEVVLSEFTIPTTDRVMFDGDRAQSLSETAAELVTSCTNDRFALSFQGNGSWTLPEGRTRRYLTEVDASDVKSTAEELQLPEPQIRTVFVTEVHDTRFDAYSVLRPLSAAH